MLKSLRVPSPQEIGLPERFEKWRPEQEDCLRMLLSRTDRVKAPAAPVGFGKTVVAVAYALLTRRTTCFVTESRGLQDQYYETFKDCGMVDLRGRRNYECHMRPDYTCQEGYVAGCPHKGSMSCPSSLAETRAATSRLVVTNYDKWTSSGKFGRGMDHFEQVIFDEGHEAPAAVERAMSITLHYKEVEDGLGIDFPAGADEMVNWQPWGRVARIECQEQYLAAKTKLEAGDAKLAKQVLHLRHLLKRLTTVTTANPRHWIVDSVKDGYQFDPIRAGRYAESVLLLKVPHVVIMSGTLRPKTMYMLGLPKEAFHFVEYESTFDRSRCPIYYIPTMRVDKNAHDLTPLWIKLDQIAGRRQDRRGIVHPISYFRQQEVVASSRFSNRMYLGAKGQGAGEIVEQFRQSPVAGSILVTPAIAAGYDFSMDAAEWQFICKIPFPDGRSKILKARQEDDKEYGAAQAANKLQQMAGRIMRQKEDQGETFICDEHMDWFYENARGQSGRFKHLFSKTFKKFFKRVEMLPAPLPKL
jgi:Rad3-related DNA helicase